MAELDIDEVRIEDSLMMSISRLAERHQGDSSQASVLREVEIALELFLVWLEGVKGGENEIEEPVTTFEFPTSSIKKENANGIRRWLFRR